MTNIAKLNYTENVRLENIIAGLRKALVAKNNRKILALYKEAEDIDFTVCSIEDRVIYDEMVDLCNEQLYSTLN